MEVLFKRAYTHTHTHAKKCVMQLSWMLEEVVSDREGRDVAFAFSSVTTIGFIFHTPLPLSLGNQRSDNGQTHVFSHPHVPIKPSLFDTDTHTCTHTGVSE